MRLMRVLRCWTLACPLAAFAAMLSPAVALAHGGSAISRGSLATTWDFEPTVIIPMAAAAALYVMGLHALWERAGRGRGISRTQAACFFAGLIVVVGALASPLDALADVLFSALILAGIAATTIASFVLSEERGEAWWPRDEGDEPRVTFMSHFGVFCGALFFIATLFETAPIYSLNTCG